MKKHNVLLDSNIYMAARYDFDGNSLLSLSKYCDKGLVSLHTKPMNMYHQGFARCHGR